MSVELMQTHSTLTCPECGHAQEMEMPTDACLFFHECSNCKVLLRPLAGDCCVFCSYGSVKCPPIQAQGSCCGNSN
nr:GDCCVxC domain-containing (seleno)protein [Limnohabitans sp.]